MSITKVLPIKNPMKPLNLILFYLVLISSRKFRLTLEAVNLVLILDAGTATSSLWGPMKGYAVDKILYHDCGILRVPTLLWV